MKLLRLLLMLSCIVMPATGFGAVERSSLKAAMDKGTITVKASASGLGYNGKGLRLNLKNNTRTTLQLKVDPALIFRPEDTTYQDLVLPGETLIVLAPGGESGIDLQSFCGKSNAHGPRKDIPFRFLKQGDSIMIKTVQFINKYGLYNGLGQSAVWALTDSHNLSGVFDSSNPEVTNKLLALMAQLTGWEVPEYFKLYKTNNRAGEPVMEMRVLKIYAVFEWKLPQPKILALGIYNSSGRLIQPVFEAKEFTRGGYKVTVEFEAENIAPGNYYIRLLESGTIIKEKTVRLD